MILYDQNIWGNFSHEQTVGNRKYLINEMIREQDPDICCFQECNPKTMRKGDNGIGELLADSYTEICSDKADINFTPVFIRKSKFDVICEGYFQYDGLNDIGSKSATYAVLKRNDGGKAFAVVSTHFWWDHGEKSDRQREENACELKRLANKLTSEYGVPVIISGDFNSGREPQSQGPAGYNKMIGLGFIDARMCSKRTTDKFTCRSKYPERTADDRYINGCQPEYSIDHIFLYGDRVNADSFDVVTEQKALDSSDHCPLIFKFDII